MNPHLGNSAERDEIKAAKEDSMFDNRKCTTWVLIGLLSPVVLVVRLFLMCRHWFCGLRKKHPTLYVCKVNGVVGVVRKEEFERILRVYRKLRAPVDEDALNAHWSSYPFLTGRLPVYPRVGLFSNKFPPIRHRLVGTIADYHSLILGCYVEERSFTLPPVDGDEKAYDQRGLKWHDAKGSPRIPTFGAFYRYVHGKWRKPPYEVSCTLKPSE